MLLCGISLFMFYRHYWYNSKIKIQNKVILTLRHTNVFSSVRMHNVRRQITCSVTILWKQLYYFVIGERKEYITSYFILSCF